MMSRRKMSATRVSKPGTSCTTMSGKRIAWPFATGMKCVGMKCVDMIPYRSNFSCTPVALAVRIKGTDGQCVGEVIS
jgi:hypothetical protein